MTPEKVIEAAVACRVVNGPWAPMRLDSNERISRRHITERSGAVRCHVAYCCEQIEVFVNEGRIEKAMRWLGWVQGVLFCLGTVSLQEGAEMNMPRPDGK